MNIAIKPYPYKNKLVSELKLLIKSQYLDLFHAVIIHGSVATNEVIKYSDFDGLLIIKDKYVNTKELKRFKSDSLKIILKFDPLQHHGWFCITKNDLNNYPEHYLPSVILKESTLLFPRTINLVIDQPNAVNYTNGLISMIDQLELNISNKWRPRNIFQLKSFLSQIMLLPALYCSAKHGFGVLKKDSFDVAKVDFTNEEWEPIMVASRIREEWDYSLNPLQQVVMTSPNYFFRKITKKIMAPRINDQIKKMLDDTFFCKLNLLLTKIKNNLNY